MRILQICAYLSVILIQMRELRDLLYYVKLGKLADGLAIQKRVVVSGQWREGEGLMTGSLV